MEPSRIPNLKVIKAYLRVAKDCRRAEKQIG